MTARWLDERAQSEREYSQVISCLAISDAVYADTVQQCVNRLNNDLNRLNHGISNVVYPKRVGLPMAIAYKRVDNEVYIAFRGTNSWESFLPSLNIRGRWNSFQGRFHQGYVQEARRYPLDAFLELLNGHPDLRMILTGHSLGGALASIVTAHLLHDAHSNDIVSRIRCIAFGAPNMCDRPCAEYLNRHFPNHFDFYINHRDIVPFIFTFVADIDVVNRLPTMLLLSRLPFIGRENLPTIRRILQQVYQIINPRYQSFGNTFQTDPIQSHINRVNTEQLLANINAEMKDALRVYNMLNEGKNDHKIKNYTRQIYDYIIFKHHLMTPSNDRSNVRVGDCSILDRFTSPIETCTLF